MKEFIAVLNRNRARLLLYHIYSRRSGLYSFVTKNLLVLSAIFIGIYSLKLIATLLFGDLNLLFANIADNFETGVLFLIFFLSESIFGILPPDLFIVWAEHLASPYAAVTALALLSYTGGIVAFAIGRRIGRFDKVNQFLAKRYNKYLYQIRKWGGLFIVIAALFPLPYTPVSMISGMIKYPFKRFIYLGIFRIVRFYLYALILFSMF